MTFNEPESIETAMAAAFQAAGHDPTFGRLVMILKSTRNQPLARQKKFRSDNAAWALLSAILDKCVASGIEPSAALPSAKPQRAPRRNLDKELETAGAEIARRNIKDISDRAVARFYLDHPDVRFREIPQIHRYAYVFRRILENYPNASPDARIRDVVRDDVIGRYLAEASHAVAA